MEPTQKQERRYRSTETLILNGLTTLLQQKSIKEITVRELADLVDINRSTFYLHYTDIYDLLEKTEQRLLQQLLDAVNQNWTLPETPKNFFAFLEQAFTILSENAQLCSALIGPNGDIAFVAKLQEYVQNSCLQEWLDAQQNHPDAVEQEQFHLQTAFIVSGCVGLCRTWLHRTPNPFTATEMAAFTEQLIGDHAI